MAKVRVTKTVDRYAPLGSYADVFKQQGWIPETWNNEFTDYKPQYGLLNSIELGGGKKGYYSVRAGNTNNQYTLYIKDANGNVVGDPIMQNVGADQIQNYFTQRGQMGSPSGSVINERATNIQAGKGGAGTFVTTVQ